MGFVESQPKSAIPIDVEGEPPCARLLSLQKLPRDVDDDVVRVKAHEIVDVVRLAHPTGWSLEERSSPHAYSAPGDVEDAPPPADEALDAP